MNIFAQLQHLPSPSPEAIEAFRQALPKLQVFANEKFVIDNKLVYEDTSCEKINLIKGFNKNFAELLMGVYEFSLYESLAQEFMGYMVMLESRGIEKSLIESALKAWIMAIRCTVKHPEADELAPPLEWLQRNISLLYTNAKSDAPEMNDNTQRFLQYILNKNRKFAAESLLSLIREGYSIEHVYTSILLPVLEYIRMLWRQNNISVADEHMATDICRYVMFRVIDSIFGERKYPFKALVSCMPGERDVLSGEIFANYIEIKGWSVYFIGQTVSGEEVIHAIQKNKPQVLVLSIASIASLPEAKALISQIRQFFPRVKVVMEGRAALLAQQKLQSEVDTLVSNFEEGHTKMLDLVMSNA